METFLTRKKTPRQIIQEIWEARVIKSFKVKLKDQKREGGIYL